jgi:hypothetical protein
LPPPPTGATVSAAPAVADALQHYRPAAVILENLKEREIEREGNPLLLLTRFFSSEFLYRLRLFSIHSADQRFGNGTEKRCQLNKLPDQKLKRFFNNLRTLTRHCPSSLIMLKLLWL